MGHPLCKWWSCSTSLRSKAVLRGTHAAMGLHFSPTEHVFHTAYGDYNAVRHSQQREALSFDSPGLALVRQSKMEFAEMPRGIFLILPPRPLTLLAKATLVALANLRDEPIVRLVRFKTTSEVHLVDLFALKNAVKRFCGYIVLESRSNPVDCECAASSALAGFFEFEGIGLE